MQFTLGTPRGTGALAFGDITQETNLPASGSREQLVVRCVDTSCKFAKELKAGYLLVIDASTASNFSSRLPVTRVITSIISDTVLTVDADFNQGLLLGSNFLGTNLPHSGASLGTAGFPIAGNGQWTFVACPPRVGKRANGVGTIESSWNQGSWSAPYPSLDSSNVSNLSISLGNLDTASGGATGLQHRIVGRGTRFATQFGPASTWASPGSGGYFGLGPYISVQVRALALRAARRLERADLRNSLQINGDWETQLVVALGTTPYDEYDAVLENSFSEPLLRTTPWQWYTMLTPVRARRSLAMRLEFVSCDVPSTGHWQHPQLWQARRV